MAFPRNTETAVMKPTAAVMNARSHTSNPPNYVSPKRPIKMGQTGCPETCVSDYQCTLCNIAEKRKSHTYRTLKTRHTPSAKTIHLNNQPVKCNTTLNRELTKRLTQLCYTRLNEVTFGFQHRTHHITSSAACMQCTRGKVPKPHRYTFNSMIYKFPCTFNRIPRGRSPGRDKHQRRTSCRAFLQPWSNAL